jgi:3-methylcrotonyl-CoA carboxylase beta subunit
MGGEQAASVLATVQRDGLEAEAEPGAPTRKKPSRRRSATSTRRRATRTTPRARLWDDGVIDPVDTRRVLALGLAAALNAPIPETKFGVFRM